MMLISGFILCTLVILYRRKKLSFYGDIISYRPGLGQSMDKALYKMKVTERCIRCKPIPVFAVIIMSAIAIVGLTYRSGDKRYKLAWDLA